MCEGLAMGSSFNQILSGAIKRKEEEEEVNRNDYGTNKKPCQNNKIFI